jgi:hypothetical protein
MMSPYGGGGLSPYGSPNDPNGTSMGINTQKFLMLFLVCPAPKTMTLEFAARVIHGEETEMYFHPTVYQCCGAKIFVLTPAPRSCKSALRLRPRLRIIY